MKKHSIGRMNIPSKRTHMTILISTLLLLLISGLTINRAWAWFNTPVKEGTFMYEYEGEILEVARSAGSTEYGYNQPAEDTHPHFYSGLIANGLDNVLGFIDYYPYRVEIYINGTDPNSNFLPVDRFVARTAYVSPKDDGAYQSVLQIIYDVLVSGLPWPLNPLVKYTFPQGQGGASTGDDGIYNAWAKWQAPPNVHDRDKGLRFGYELVVDPTLEGTYTINIHYRTQIFLSIAGFPGHVGYIDLYDTVEYTYLVNDTPYTPYTPSGPTYGYRNEWCTYSTGTTDPDGDNVRYEFEFSGPIPTISFTTGWYASGQTGSLTVMWEPSDPPGTYYVRARAQDVHGEWSGWSPSLTVTIVNRSPNTPSMPSGPSSGYTGSSYTYSTSTTDPDGDNVCYKFDWGDGSTTTTGWYSSGSTASRSHSWSSTGTYYVKVKAQDSYGAWSGWSSSRTVYISGGGGGGGGCPILFVWDGMEYVCEGLLDIHDPDGTDVVTEHTLATTPKQVRRTYRLRLTEHPQTISHIDQVKLYAILEDETLVELPLVSAWHSGDGYVRPQLLFSDDWKTDMLGADHNDGTSQSINLRFLAQPPNMEVTSFLFVIEGNNRYFKVLY